MREIKGEVGKKTHKKKLDFYDVTWLIFETLCPSTLGDLNEKKTKDLTL